MQSLGYKLNGFNSRSRDLPADALHEIQSNLIRLGALEPPSGLDAGTRERLQSDITQAFLFGLRLIHVCLRGSFGSECGDCHGDDPRELAATGGGFGCSGGRRKRMSVAGCERENLYRGRCYRECEARMMNVLVLNSGSSSLKFQIIGTDLEQIKAFKDDRILRGEVEGIGGEAIVKIRYRKEPGKTLTAPLRDMGAALDYLLRYDTSHRNAPEFTEIKNTAENTCRRSPRRARRGVVLKGVHAH